jgi:anaerobic magnesium-protoporphyrin IX monomethyl ester cyclase
MKVALLFPPATDPRAPHLALPSLAASLRQAGIQTELIDLDLQGLLWLLGPQAMADAVRRSDRASRGPLDAAAQRLLASREIIAERANTAVSSLQGERFYDPHAYNDARNAIGDALDLHSLASEGAHYNILNIRYDVDGVDPASLRDLIRCTSRPEGNLFHQHWENSLYPSLARLAPEVVGITITNRQQLIPGLYLARELRRRGHFVVLGGTVLTKFAEPLKRRPQFFEHFADAVVLYEGETALLSLIDARERGRALDDVPNLLFARGSTVVATITHVENVSTLPTPDFEGLPLDQYLAPEPVLPILTGKGCYFNRCKFCDIPFINHVSSKPYRVRSPETVVRDCLTLSRRFACRHFVVTDEALSPKLLSQLADALEPHRHQRFRFTGYARLEPGFTPDVCTKIARAGFRKLFFGLESASQKTLDHMDKGIKVSGVPAVLGNLRRAEVQFHLFSIVGFPEESEASAQETLAFFLDNVETIDAPGNSFDIHPFGLELRTPYFAGADALGLVIHPAALAREFVIGLSAEEWDNSRGLDRNRAQRLIAHYNARLRARYQRFHNCPGHLWPGFEEYSVLYPDWYQSRDFPYRTSLHPDDDRREYRVRWSADTAVDAHPDRVVLRSRSGSATLSPAIHALLSTAAFETFPETAARLVTQAGESLGQRAAAGLRALVAELAGKGLLRIETRALPAPICDTAGSPAPGRYSPDGPPRHRFPGTEPPGEPCARDPAGRLPPTGRTG